MKLFKNKLLWFCLVIGSSGFFFFLIFVSLLAGTSNKPPNECEHEDRSSVSQEISDWKLVLVNRQNIKPEMNPSLETVGNIQVDSRIAQATRDFLSAAQGIDSAFHLISGYRSVAYQEEIYNGYVTKEMNERGVGREEAIQIVQEYSQPAGASEHQTGLAIDISTVDSLNQMNPDTASKLARLAPQFGFVLRFKEEKKPSTGIGYEDWHYRYVGKEAAEYMTQHNLSLEEYHVHLKSASSSSQSATTSETQQYPSIEEFVKKHKEAYLLSWKAGGFLPSASIAQTMVENGFNFTNPSGTSFWQAHNMGGVKTSSKDNFPITLATYGEDSVDLTGTKPGTNVGDNTGGAYTWFKDYNAGIVGKAEFMAHQTLYVDAINNTNGPAALTAIFKGGWATDPHYLTSLLAAYNTVGKQFQWLDQEAIALYGNQTYKGGTPNITFPSAPPADDCGVSSTSLSTTGSNSAPTLEIPAEYKSKLPFPEPNNQNYAGNNYPLGQCTWGAYNRMAQIGKPIEWFSGNAGNGGLWYTAAESAGYKVTKGKATLGEAACFPPGVAGADPVYGHIGVVEYVNDDGSILISEVNVVASGTGTRSWRVISASEVAQMYFIEGKG